jgi:hypothetical protein
MSGVNAWGLKDPQGNLTSFASHGQDALFEILAFIGMAESGEAAREKLLADGWSVVQVRIEEAEEA